MNMIERIEGSVELKMAFSELLFGALDMGCWHEWESKRPHGDCCGGSTCINCEVYSTQEDRIYNESLNNPNLFLESAFLTVFKAVKDREDFQETWGHWHDLDAVDESMVSVSINMNSIASPSFQLEILTWLASQDKELEERVEKVLREVG